MFRKIMASIVGLLILAIAGLAAALSYTSSCPVKSGAGSIALIENTAGGAAKSMIAATYACYGPPENVQLATRNIPEPAADEVLIELAKASVNPLDWHYMRGAPYIMRMFSGIGAPNDERLGSDFAGTVVATGKSVEQFAVGDRVFGGGWGSFAGYMLRGEDRAFTVIPEGVSFEAAAAVPIAGVTALQALRDHGDLQAGQRVLINGASGGVGTHAVQIAKAMGAHVTGVCSGRNVEMVKSIGADAVINYKESDYTGLEQRYDLIVDMVGNHSPLENRAVLSPGGKLVIVGGSKGNWLGPLSGPLVAMASDPFVDEKLITFTASMRREDLVTLAQMMADGTLKPVIDRRYSLSEIREALAYSESGRARGKIIIEIPAAD